jgi:hypothetical protein
MDHSTHLMMKDHSAPDDELDQQHTPDDKLDHSTDLIMKCINST